ncbi:MAG: gfo/Idh/MocA family oxidoreductase [Nitrospiraceae bacterium]|nr:MAG: gfo/Idh/MocA family oxidoreductase [Nitrospiraceae bacterium]
MINIGIVGYGYWGPNLVRNFVENNKCQVLYICELDRGKWPRIQRKYSDIILTNNYDDLLKDPCLNAIVIATPVSTHYPLAKQALLSKKDIFVEKPLTTKITEAEDLNKLAEDNGCVLFVDHTFKYSPPVIKIKEILDRGELGEIQYITSSRINLGLHQKDISVICDLAPHDLSILFYWLDEDPVEISVRGKGFIREDIPDVAFINMKFPSGILANIHISWLSPIKLRKTVIVGSKKMLVFDDTQPVEKIKIYDKGISNSDAENFYPNYRTGNIISPSIDTAEPLRLGINHFLECVEQRKKPSTGGEDAIRVAKALQYAEKSLKMGGRLLKKC